MAFLPLDAGRGTEASLTARVSRAWLDIDRALRGWTGHDLAASARLVASALIPQCGHQRLMGIGRRQMRIDVLDHGQGGMAQDLSDQ